MQRMSLLTWLLFVKDASHDYGTKSLDTIQGSAASKSSASHISAQLKHVHLRLLLRLHCLQS